MDEFERSTLSDHKFTRGRVTDPFDTGNPQGNFLYASIRRARGTIRANSLLARDRAREVNRSIRYAVSRPIVPVEQYRETDDQGREYISEFEYLSRQIRVLPPEPDVTQDQYATYLRTKVKYGNINDRVLKVLMPTRKERMKFLQIYGEILSCSPPPVFMLIFIMMQIGMFVFYVVRLNTLENGETIGVDAHDSMWIYDPYKRDEAWRWVTYSVLHYDAEHLVGNVLLQLLVGILLELVFKWRICVVFILGVLSGSLASSCVDPYVKLLGSSGGSYAIIGAYMALIMRRFRELPRNMRLLNGIIGSTLFVYVVIDFGVAYHRRYNGDSAGAKVSHIAHIAGMFTGWTVGYTTLHTVKSKLTNADIAPYLGLVIFLLVYLTAVILAIVFNIFLSPVGNVRD